MKTVRKSYLSVLDPTQTSHLKEIVKTVGEECRKEYGEMQHFRPSAGLPNQQVESKDESKKNWDNWKASSEYPVVDLHPLFLTMLENHAEAFRDKYDRKCDCQMCLMMCGTYQEYSVLNKALGFKHIDMDDDWMVHFDCDKTRDLNHFVVLPKPADEKTAFDH